MIPSRQSGLDAHFLTHSRLVENTSNRFALLNVCYPVQSREKVLKDSAQKLKQKIKTPLIMVKAGRLTAPTTANYTIKAAVKSSSYSCCC